MESAGYVMSEFTSAVEGKELTGHGISTIMVVDVHHCHHHCETDSSCWSVNYESSSSLTSKLCTLNDGDDISYPQQLTSNPTMSYCRKVSHQISILCNAFKLEIYSKK